MKIVGFLLFFKLRGTEGLCQPNSASDLKLPKKQISRTDLPSEGRSALHASFLLICLLHNLVLPFFCAQRWFHSLSPALRVPGAQFNERGSRVAMDTLPWCLHRQGSHVPSFHKCQQKLLTCLSSLSIATSLTSKGLGLPMKFDSQPSKSCSPEETQYFLLKYPAQGLKPVLLRWGKSSTPHLKLQHCSTLCSLCSSQPEQPAQPTLTSQLTCQILLGNSSTE